jgi:hypothetical protein
MAIKPIKESSFLWLLSKKAEGRRQEAGGNTDSYPLPVTVGNKGLKPPLKKNSVALVQKGFESLSVASASRRVQNLLPPASFKLLLSASL